MEENRFERQENNEAENCGKTRELDSIALNAVESERRGITPRDRFAEENQAPDMEKTLRMDSITDGARDEDKGDDYYGYAPDNPVKKRKKKKKKKQINHTRTMGQIFLGVLISVGAVCVGVMLAIKAITALRDITGMAKAENETEVIITDSMNLDDIANELHEKKIIEMPALFKAYFNITDDGKRPILDGDYLLTSDMSYSSLIATLQTKKTYSSTVTIMIPEGADAKQIGELLEENLVCRAKDFEMYYKSKLSRYDFEEGIDSEDRFYALEGYLFPDTYEFYVIDDLVQKPNMDTLDYAKQAADKMYRNFETKITPEMTERMKELGLSLDETITLASLIQKEGTTLENMELISSVFHNRLADPVNFPNLQTDTTNVYIDNVIKPSVPESAGSLYDDVIAAYDTYSCEGLPVGPICSPGLEAITAALDPASTNYYYFLCSEDGVFYFAETDEQHEQNKIDAALKDEET